MRYAQFASGMPAQPEDQLKGPVQTLIQVAHVGVLTRTEVQVDDLGGRPDIGVQITAAWTAALTQGLVELLHVLEATVAAQPELNALLDHILSAPQFAASELPMPTAAERAAPDGESPDAVQGELF